MAANEACDDEGAMPEDYVTEDDVQSAGGENRQPAAADGTDGQQSLDSGRKSDDNVPLTRMFLSACNNQLLHSRLQS